MEVSQSATLTPPLPSLPQVVNFDTATPDRAAFGLVIRSSADDLDDRVHAYCLAASFSVLNIAATGRCPEAIEAALTAAGTVGAVAAGDSQADFLASLKACVTETKRAFLDRLCRHIVQVSCLASAPEELMVDVEPEELLGFDLEYIFSAATNAVKSKM